MKRTTYQKSETQDPGPRTSTDGTPGLGTPRPQNIWVGSRTWDPQNGIQESGPQNI